MFSLKKFWDKFCPDPFIDEYRELVKAEAERVRIENAASAFRLAQEKAKKEEEELRLSKNRLRASFIFQFKLGEISCLGWIHLLEDGKGERSWKVQDVRRLSDNGSKEFDASSVLAYVRSLWPYSAYLRPWLDGSIDTEQLAASGLKWLQMPGQARVEDYWFDGQG